MTDYPYVENPEAIGDPDQTPVVNLGPDLYASMRASGMICGCGGMNGWHKASCPTGGHLAAERGTLLDEGGEE